MLQAELTDTGGVGGRGATAGGGEAEGGGRQELPVAPKKRLTFYSHTHFRQFHLHLPQSPFTLCQDIHIYIWMYIYIV